MGPILRTVNAAGALQHLWAMLFSFPHAPLPLPQKLLAFEKFLEEHPEWRDKVGYTAMTSHVFIHSVALHRPALARHLERRDRVGWIQHR